MRQLETDGDTAATVSTTETSMRDSVDEDTHFCAVCYWGKEAWSEDCEPYCHYNLHTSAHEPQESKTDERSLCSAIKESHQACCVASGWYDVLNAHDGCEPDHKEYAYTAIANKNTEAMQPNRDFLHNYHPENLRQVGHLPENISYSTRAPQTGLANLHPCSRQHQRDPGRQ